MYKLSNILAAFALLLLPLCSMAQSQSPMQKWIHSFEGKKGITTISISQTMFKMLSKLKSGDPGYQDIINFAPKLQEFKLVTLEEGNNPVFKNWLSQAPLQNYEELMSINDEGNRIVFMVLQSNDMIHELLMTISGSDQLLLFIKGNFRLSELTDISGDMNISGMDKIKKTKK